MRTIDYQEMKRMLAEKEATGLSYKDIENILLNGSIGYKDIDDEEIFNMFETQFGLHKLPKIQHFIFKADKKEK